MTRTHSLALQRTPPEMYTQCELTRSRVARARRGKNAASAEEQEDLGLDITQHGESMSQEWAGESRRASAEDLRPLPRLWKPKVVPLSAPPSPCAATAGIGSSGSDGGAAEQRKDCGQRKPESNGLVDVPLKKDCMSPGPIPHSALAVLPPQEEPPPTLVTTPAVGVSLSAPAAPAAAPPDVHPQGADPPPAPLLPPADYVEAFATHEPGSPRPSSPVPYIAAAS